jgi:hypothetical protein
MKILKPFLPAELFGFAVFALAGITAVGAEPRVDRPQADQDAGKSEPAKPKGTPETGVGENERDELEQLLEEAEKERLAYSPDKKLLAHLDRRQVTVWSIEERRRLHQIVLDGRSLAAAFSSESVVFGIRSQLSGSERAIASYG